jgi:hypothetical protein
LALALVVQVAVRAHVLAVFPQVPSAAAQLEPVALCAQALLVQVVQAVVRALVAQVAQVEVSVHLVPVVLTAALVVLVQVVPVVVLVVQAAVVLVRVVEAMANAVHQRRSRAHVVAKISTKCCRSQQWVTPQATRQFQKALLLSNAVLLPKNLHRSSIAPLLMLFASSWSTAKW